MVDIIIRPSGQAAGDFTGAVELRDVTLPLSSFDTEAAGITDGSAYDYQVLSDAATITVAEPPAANDAVFSSTFGPDFPTEYPTQAASLQGVNASFTHDPAAAPQGRGPGALFMDKSGNFPRGRMDLPTLKANTTYEIVAEMVIFGSGASGAGSFNSEVRETGGSDNISGSPASLDGQIVEDAPNSQYVWNVTHQVTTGSETEHFYQVRWGGNVGSTGGADIYLTSLTVTEVT